MMHLTLVTLLLSPWKGPSFPTASAAAAKYKLTVRGGALQSVRLRASGLPSGWIASFCTKTFCAPFRYTLKLDERGIGVVEFQAIRTDEDAPRRVHAIVESTGAAPVAVQVIAASEL
jgi:hypothetical protein